MIHLWNWMVGFDDPESPLSDEENRVMAYLRSLPFTKKDGSQKLPVHSDRIRDLVGRRPEQYRKTLESLQEKGLVVVDPSYWAGKSTRRYGVTKKGWELGSQSKLIKRKSRICNLGPFLDNVTDGLDKFCENQLYMMNSIELDAGFCEVFDSCKLNPDRANRVSEAGNAILRKDTWISRGEKSGRIYSTITNAPKEIRRYLSYSGTRLVEGDIKTCFPILLLALYDEQEDSCFGDDMDETKIRDILAERELYEKFLSGDFYQEMMDISGYKGNRKSFKRDFQVYLNWDGEVEKIARPMSLVFPILSRLISEKGDGMASFLQSLESSIMVEGVLGQCLRKKIPIITIHDGFLCLPSDFDKIAKMITDKFLLTVQFSPVLTRDGEFWGGGHHNRTLEGILARILDRSKCPEQEVIGV
jgi:hypothetical protein